MSRVMTLLIVFTVFAFALMVIGFLTPSWQSESEEDTDGQAKTTETLTTVGLTDFHWSKSSYSAADGSFISSDEYSGPLTVGDLTHVRKTPTTEKTEIITPPASEQIYKIIGSVLSDSVEARDGVIGTGIPALLFACAFLLCLVLSHKRKGHAKCRHIGVVFIIITILLVFVGVFLYSEVLNVGACLVVWTGFCIFAALTGFFVGNAGGSGRARWTPIGFWLLALLLAGVALGVSRWMSQTRDTLRSDGISPDYTIRSSQYAGVNGYGFENSVLDSSGVKSSATSFSSTFFGDSFTTVVFLKGNTVTTTYQKCDDPSQDCSKAMIEEQTTFAPFKLGSQEVLGCGIPAMIFLFATGMGLLALSMGKGPRVTKTVTAVCAFVSSGFGFMGLFLYSAQTSVGYSFILYSGAGFCWVLVLVLAVFTLDPSFSHETDGLLRR